MHQIFWVLGVLYMGVRMQTAFWLCSLFSVKSVFCFHTELNLQEVSGQNFVPGIELTIGDSLILTVYSKKKSFGEKDGYHPF